MSVTIRPYRKGGWEVDIRVVSPDGTRRVRERKHAPISSRTARRASCQDCAEALSLAQTQADQPACPATHGRDGTPGARRGSRGHRTVARS